MTNTPTPRTDDLWYQHTSDPRLLAAADGEDTVSIELTHYREMAEHAQQLERELAALRLQLLEAITRERTWKNRCYASTDYWKTRAESAEQALAQERSKCGELTAALSGAKGE